VIKDIHDTARRSGRRNYQMIIYSDHGQETVGSFESETQKPVRQAVKEVLSEMKILKNRHNPMEKEQPFEYLYQRARHLFFKTSAADSPPPAAAPDSIQVTAMGPLGHVYLPFQVSKKEKIHIAENLVFRGGIPLVLFTTNAAVMAVNEEGCFDLSTEAKRILGKRHPYLQAVSEDLKALCRHPDAGDMVLSGWKAGKKPISFAIERGAHGGPGTEETRGFALLSGNVDISSSYLRGTDLREYAIQLLTSEMPVALPAEK
jgi:hypothetical protein